MQQLFLESPWTIAVSGLVVVVACVVVWIQTGHRVAVACAALGSLITLLLLAICIQIETDREAIKRTINEVAEAIEQNDHARVFSYIHPGAGEGIARARAELPQYEFSDARVTRVKSISVNQETSPPTALAEFNVVVAVRRSGQNVKVARFVKVYFMQENGRWLVRDYEHFEPTAGFRTP